MTKLSAFAALWQALRGQRRPDAPALSEQLAALPRLISRTLRGGYPGMGRSRLLWMALALAYIVSPVDLLPESMFMVLGLGDDAIVLSWLAGALLTETEAFLRWERGQQAGAPAAGEHVVVGEVI